MSAYILAVDSADDLRRFAEEVAPAARELVADAPRQPDAPRRGRGRPVTAAPLAARADARPDAPAQRRARVGRGDAADRPGARPGAHLQRASRPPASTSSTSTTRCAPSSPSCATSSSRSRPARATRAAVRSFINRMTIRQNHWTLGTFCETYCRVGDAATTRSRTAACSRTCASSDAGARPGDRPPRGGARADRRPARARRPGARRAASPPRTDGIDRRRPRAWTC